MRKVKTTFSASEFITQFNEISINYVNLPNKECFMIHSITNGLKSIFPLPKLTKIPLEAWRFAFFSSFSSSQLFRFRRQTSNEMEPAWLCFGTRPLEIRSPLPVQRKKYFSPRVITVVVEFKNNSKERHIFSEFKHAICDKMKNKRKICAKEWSRKHFFHSHFFIFHHKPKRMLKCLQKGF